MADSIFSLPENFDPSRENVHYLRDVVMDIVTRKGMLQIQVTDAYQLKPNTIPYTSTYYSSYIYQLYFVF